MPEYRGIKLRHELKYLISETDYLWLRDRLLHAMPLDKHANAANRGYHIRSLYFDDIYNSAMWDKQEGLPFRSKYRIRIYNRSDAVISLEKKSKFGSYTAKESAPLTRKQCDDLLAGRYDFLYPSEEPLFQELYAHIRSELLRPRVIVDYEREPYIYPTGNVRVTFDREIHTAQFSTDIFSPLPAPIPILDPGTLVLEVKYDDFLAPQVKSLLQGLQANHTAFSKYAMCRKYH